MTALDDLVQAIRPSDGGRGVILVGSATTPADTMGMRVCEGILTARGAIGEVHLGAHGIGPVQEGSF